MSLLQTAASLFLSKLGGAGEGIDVAQVVQALSGLLPTEGGELDLGALAGQFMGNSGGLAELASSWLGDGANANISASQIMEMFGGDAIAKFAGDVGVDQASAASGLADMIPELMDKTSAGGAINTDLIQNIGGSLLGKLF